MPAPASPTPASATAMTVRRAATLATRRARAAIGRLPDRPSRGGDGEKRSFKPREDRGGEKRPYTPRGDRPNFNRDDRPRRAGSQKRPRGSRRCPPGRAFFRQEIRRQEALYAARSWRREAALHAARRRFSQGRRPSARRSALQRRDRRATAIVPRRSARAKIWRRQEVLLPRRARSWPAQGFRRPTAARRIQAVAEARRRLGSCRSAIRVPPRDGARNFDKPRFDKPRDDRGGEATRPRSHVRAMIVPRAIVRNSIARVAIATATPAARRPHRLAGASAQRSR